MEVNQIRIWIAQWGQSRQIISFFTGDKTLDCCKRLWGKLPYSYLKGNRFTHFWRAYTCIPKETHQQVGKPGKLLTLNGSLTRSGNDSAV